MIPEEKRSLQPIKAVLIFALVLLMLFGIWLGWVYLGSNFIGQSRQRRALVMAEAAVSNHADAETRPEAGKPAWVLSFDDRRLPVFGDIDSSSLNRGVGWYPTTSLPGQPGNVVLAGHRYSEGKPFEWLTELSVGDEIVLETPVARYIYAVRVPASELTVSATDSWVLDPVPGQSFAPHEAILTLTTQQDFAPTDDRAVAFAALIKEEKK